MIILLRTLIRRLSLSIRSNGRMKKGVLYKPHHSLTYNRKRANQQFTYNIMCDGKDSNEKKAAKDPENRLSLSDFCKLKPWDLRHKTNGRVITAFTFVPDRFKEGPWIPAATWAIVFTLCLVFCFTIDANIKYYNSNSNSGIMKEFVGDKSYPAFTVTWYYNVALFSWMSYVAWSMYNDYKSFGAWVTFTVLSWTMMCIRHGLCALAPFLPSLRLLIGVLRFPVLLTSSATFGVWNFVLMPVLSFGLLKGETRSRFLKWAFSWRLCQIHILNIFYAYLNCVWAEPKNQGLHMGDVNATVVYMVSYILFYYCILDRIGIQLYPIFSPRTYMCLPALAFAVGLCGGNYVFWDKILTGIE